MPEFSVTPWTIAHQTPLSTGFSRQEYWSGLSFPFPGKLPDSGVKLGSPAVAGGFFYCWATRVTLLCMTVVYFKWCGKLLNTSFSRWASYPQLSKTWWFTAAVCYDPLWFCGPLESAEPFCLSSLVGSQTDSSWGWRLTAGLGHLGLLKFLSFHVASWLAYFTLLPIMEVLHSRFNIVACCSRMRALRAARWCCNFFD